MPFVLGIDSSTQSTKAEVRDLETGVVIASGKASHPPTSPPVSEQDPRAWWDALVDAVNQLGDARREVAAVSVAGQQHGLVLLDGADEPLRKAKLWNDTTSAEVAARLVEQQGASWWAETLGVVPVAAFTITKLAWVAEHEPDLLPKLAKVMLPHDYLTYRLAGQHVTDRGDASGTGWFDSVSGSVSTAALEAIGDYDWDHLLPRVLGPTESAGELTTAAAAALGLPTGIPVGPGTGDNMGAALGLGLRTGDIVVSLGTSGTVYGRTMARANDPSGAVAGFCDATGQYLPLVCTLNATKVTDSVARWLGTDAPGLAELALEAGTGPLETTLVPYFDGERTPNRPDARGVFVGLSNDTTRAQIARAAHDGVVCGLLDGADALSETSSGSDARLLLVGGGGRSVAYRQRLAALAGRPVRVPSASEAVAAGAAVQAAMTLEPGIAPEDRAANWSLDDSDVVEPDDVESRVEIRSRYHAASNFEDGLCRPLAAS